MAFSLRRLRKEWDYLEGSPGLWLNYLYYLPKKQRRKLWWMVLKEHPKSSRFGMNAFNRAIVNGMEQYLGEGGDPRPLRTVGKDLFPLHYKAYRECNYN